MERKYFSIDKGQTRRSLELCGGRQGEEAAPTAADMECGTRRTLLGERLLAAEQMAGWQPPGASGCSGVCRQMEM